MKIAWHPRQLWLLLLLTSSLLLTPASFATQPSPLSFNGTDSIELLSNLLSWDPPEAREDLLEAEQALADDLFSAVTKPSLKTQDGQWFYMQFLYTGPKGQENWINFQEIMYETLDVYIQSGSGEWQTYRVGLNESRYTRPNNYALHSVPFYAQQDQLVRVFFYLSNQNPAQVSPLAQSDREMNKYMITHMLNIGLSVGFLIGILFYFTFAPDLGLGRLTMLGFYIFVATATWMNGYHQGLIYYMVEDFGAKHSNYYFYAVCCHNMALLLFVRGIFNTPVQANVFDKLILLLFFSILGLIAASNIFGFEALQIEDVQVITQPTLVLVIALVIYAFVKKFKSAKYLMAGLICYVAFLAFGNATYAGLFELNMWTRSAHVGAIMSFGLFLAIAIAQRSQLIQREKLLFEKKASAAEASNQIKSDFLAMMSHEIRTPINGILGMAQMLEKTKLNHDQHNYTGIILGAGKTLLNIINDILDLSRLEAGQMPIETNDFNLDNLLTTTASVFTIKNAEQVGEEITDKQVLFDVIIDPKIPMHLKGDNYRLQQVLNNLLSNAFKFTDSGSITLRTSLMSRDKDTVQVRFAVEDTGIGIETDAIANLFDAYAQADKSTTRRYGGTGLGLTICKRIVEAMGGTIGVDSDQGKGSTFWFDVQFEIDHQRADDSNAIKDLLVGKHVAIVYTMKHYQNHIASHIRNWGINVQCLDPKNSTSDIEAEELDFLILSAYLPLDIQRVWIEYAASNNVNLIIMESWKTEFVFPLDVMPYPFTSIRLPSDLENIQTVMANLSKSKPEATDQPQPTPNKQLSGLTVLVAEDNPVNQKVIEAFLKLHDMTFTVTVNGKEALREIESGARYDFVLMDCEMPEMDGFEATRRIREFETENNIGSTPIYALTAHAMKDIHERCTQVGMDGVIVKPINFEQLIELMQNQTQQGQKAS